MFVGVHDPCIQKCREKGDRYQVVLQCHWVSPLPCPSCSCLFLPFLSMESRSTLRGLLKFWALWWGADGWYLEDNQAHNEEGNVWDALIRRLLSCQPPVQAHRQCCSQLKDLRALCQLPLEGSWFLQAQDIFTVSLTAPAAQVAPDSTAQLVGAFHPGAHQLVGYITKTWSVPIFTDPCAVHYQQVSI